MLNRLGCLITLVFIVLLSINGCTPAEESATPDVNTILLEADVSEVDGSTVDVMVELAGIIRQRLEYYGINGTVNLRQNNRLLVELPLETDAEEVGGLLVKRGLCEFRITELNADGRLVELSDYLAMPDNHFIDGTENTSRFFLPQSEQDEALGNAPVIAVLKYVEGKLDFVDLQGNPVDAGTLSDNGGSFSWLPAAGDDGTILTNAYILDAESVTGFSDKPVVNFTWTARGAEIFSQVALKVYQRGNPSFGYNFKQVVGIFIDGVLITAPVIMDENYGDGGIISGDFTLQELAEIGLLLKLKPLPVPVAVVE